MKDIIITGAQGSGKSDFAYRNFEEDYNIKDEMSLEDIKKLSSSVKRPENGKPYLFITQEPVDLLVGKRRFIVINMPDNGRS